MIDAAAQVSIAVFGVTAVWLSQAKAERVRRWACVFGMLSQPAWFWATWQAGQWGIFALCFLYLLSWLRGVRTYWWRRA